MMAADGLLHQEQVASATHASLVRLAGGGCARWDASGPDGIAHGRTVVEGTFGDNARWIEELRKLAHSSVSFPNGPMGRWGIEGKPHDVEVRAALALYHRLRGSLGGGGKKEKETEKEKEKKGKRKRKMQCAEQCSNAMRNVPAGEVENAAKNDYIEITSDMGTRRRIDSALSLARLLAIELEGEMQRRRMVGRGESHDAQNGPDDEPGMDNLQPDEDTSGHAQPVHFADIRPDDSGIICLVSAPRSEQLHAAGRMPCAHCTGWFKGAKGVWWHQLAAHGIEYAAATEAAAGAANELAIVPYEERPVGMPLDRTRSSSGTTKRDVSTADEGTDAFCMVKTGDYEEFVRLIEKGGFRPETQLDRNGASALHWAAGCGRVDFVAYLVETCGCGPNQPQRGKRSFRGRTPLHWAARKGHLNVVEYLVGSCKVDIDAKTSDGTTAFCWASWQGHLDVMKYLHRNGCDVHASNSFGCNAVLWSAQGDGTSEAMAWLLQCGLDFSVVNSNGHSALHKAAQRGGSGTIKWLVDACLFDEDVDGSVFVGPDAEGNCPSDLCGMEGHESLARWLSKQECDCITRSTADTNACLPSWLRKELGEAKLSCATHLKHDANEVHWGAGCGVRRIASSLLGYRKAAAMPNDDVVESSPRINFSDID